MTDTFRLDLTGFDNSSAADRSRIFSAILCSLPKSKRDEVLGVLDGVTTPLRPRQIERALLATDLSNRERRAVTAALKEFDIIMMVQK